jgi:hypothetical protein
MEELEFGLVVTAPSIFHTKETHVSKMGIGLHTKCPEKNLNWKPF